MAIKDKFKTRDGRLTQYAYACGYIERKELDDDNRIVMNLEPNGYHIKGFKNGLPVWDIIETGLTTARKTFDSYFTTGTPTQLPNSRFYTNLLTKEEKH
jgi:hypothetical protein